MPFRCLIAVILMILLNGCTSLIAIRSTESRRLDAPTYEAYGDFYFWGIKGKAVVDTMQICGQRSVDQLEAVYTIEDMLFIFFSWGIYSPRTYRVWCGPEGKEVQ